MLKTIIWTTLLHRKSNEFDPVTLNFKVYIILKLNELQISDMHTKNKWL